METSAIGWPPWLITFWYLLISEQLCLLMHEALTWFLQIQRYQNGINQGGHPIALVSMATTLCETRLYCIILGSTLHSCVCILSDQLQEVSSATLNLVPGSSSRASPAVASVASVDNSEELELALRDAMEDTGDVTPSRKVSRDENPETRSDDQELPGLTRVISQEYFSPGEYRVTASVLASFKMLSLSCCHGEVI